MIFSMTGYGRAETEIDGKKAIVEINTLNNRYCEIQIRLPKSYAHLESELKQIVLERIKRGKVLISITLEENPEMAAARLELNSENARTYYRILEALKKEFKLSGKIDINSFVAMPDLIKPADEKLDEESFKQVIVGCLKSALEELTRMRKMEGEHLLTDVTSHIDNIGKAVLEIEKSAADNLKLYDKKLRLRLKELLGEISISEEMIAAEAAMVAERSDITEECVRIKSHLAMFRASCSEPGPIGKKMNFILQELYREANTIGSKSISPEVSGNAILLKEEIEKAREQVQNIE